MESGDASNEEGPCDPKRKDLMPKEWLKVISMLFAMETEGCHNGHCQKNWLGMCRAKSMQELGIINSRLLEFFCEKTVVMYKYKIYTFYIGHTYQSTSTSGQREYDKNIYVLLYLVTSASLFESYWP